MPSTFNPYYTPSPARPCTPTDRAKSRMLDRLAARSQPDSAHLVYLLAHARRADYYIDVARDFAEIHRFALDNCDRQLRLFGTKQAARLRLVWCEAFGDEAAARQRCAEVRALPHAWQRRLVDQFNPDWLDLDELMIGYPWLCCVGERGLTPFAHPDD
jgi:predicted GIY-YIG superfamily endonuclease